MSFKEKKVKTDKFQVGKMQVSFVYNSLKKKKKFLKDFFFLGLCKSTKMIFAIA